MSALNLHLPSAAKQLNLSLYNCIFGPLRTKAESQSQKSTRRWVQLVSCWVAKCAADSGQKVQRFNFLEICSPKNGELSKEERQRRQHKQGNKQKCRLDCVVDGPSPSPYAGSALCSPSDCQLLRLLAGLVVKTASRATQLCGQIAGRVATAAAWSLNPQRIRKV